MRTCLHAGRSHNTKQANSGTEAFKEAFFFGILVICSMYGRVSDIPHQTPSSVGTSLYTALYNVWQGVSREYVTSTVPSTVIAHSAVQPNPLLFKGGLTSKNGANDHVFLN